MKSDDEEEINTPADALVVASRFAGTGKYVASVAFRGQADFEWGAVPGIYRTSPFFDKSIDRPHSINSFVASAHALESIFVEKFFLRARIHLNNPERGFASDRILAQHFGVPTRLLDWSANPLVALYFAVSDPDHEDKDGSFYFLHPANRSVSRLPTEEQLTAHKKANDMFMLDPPYIDQRIPAQSAKLTFHTIDKDAKTFTPLEQQEFEPGKHWLRKFRIPSRAKGTIYRELLQIGVDHHSIFPDLQGLGEQMRRNFLLRVY
ncbi:FRG domain-containing protein [Pseudorhodobacter turbinis]|uniref:FRG domain-containing protein n=1 Tax=Pseudorhodobacter turbinis TaxID=2500533 RepID=A0A4P8EDL4_9RHOB|nr:FRG domain-containing protein [Pseudorhodobacter turbinis]QCO54842.1 FRG domain-containing protein [Pseudorhodobacter turbinis]